MQKQEESLRRTKIVERIEMKHEKGQNLNTQSAKNRRMKNLLFCFKHRETVCNYLLFLIFEGMLEINFILLSLSSLCCFLFLSFLRYPSSLVFCLSCRPISLLNINTIVDIAVYYIQSLPSAFLSKIFFTFPNSVLLFSSEKSSRNNQIVVLSITRSKPDRLPRN